MTTELELIDGADDGDLLEDVYPLTGLQQGLLFHHLLGHDEYVLQAWVEVAGDVDPERLRAAADLLLRRHPQLRAGFWADEIDDPVQFVPRSVDVALTVHRCAIGNPADDPALADLLAGEGRDLDLSRPPLLRFAVLHGATRTRIVLTAHHILLDGWSVPLIFTELLTMLGTGAGALGEAVPLRDYLAWLGDQDEPAAARAYARLLDGWAGPTLVAAPTAPTDVSQTPGPATAVTDPVAAVQIVRTVDAATSAALTAVLRSAGLTPASAIRALWAVTLGGLTGSRDVVFGGTVSGRDAPVPGVDRIIGLLINTLPLRARLDPAAGLRVLARELQDQQAALLEHHHVGLRAVQAAVGTAPLFDTLLVVENQPALTGAPAGPTVLATGAGDRTHYPLTVQVEPGTRLTLILTVRPDLLDPAVADAAADRLVSLIETVATPGGLDLPQASLWATGPAMTGLARPVPDCSLTDLLTDAIATHPDRTAVRYGSTGLSYAELGRRAAVIAGHLRDRGVGVDSVVGLEMERGEHLLPAVLGVLFAGGAYLPLDPALPGGRVEQMCAAARPVAILTDADVTALLADPTPPSAPHLKAANNTPLDALAYVIFTSGSTGVPKGVGVSHRAIVNRLLWMQDTYRLTPGEPVLHKTPLSFDVSIWELFWPLTCGATVVVAPPQAHRDPQHLLDLMTAEGVSTVHFVPSMLRAFTEAVTDLSGTRLTRVLCSGEALLASDVQALRRSAGSCSVAADLVVHNLYGPTEAAVDVTWTPVRHSAAGDVGPVGGSVVGIGAPVWNTTLLVLDGMLRPVPAGFPGELYLLGVQLARGYAGRAALTADRFVAALDGSGQRMYRTGDLVRLRTDGGLDYLGRSDDQVKIRGMRIEPAEIAAVLGGAPGVGRAAVIAQQTGDRVQLVGYLVVESDSAATGPDAATVDLDEVRRHAAAALPEHMVPGSFVLVPRIPVTANGKLDGTALRQLAAEHPTAGQQVDEPLTGAAENALAAVIADCLTLTEAEYPGPGADFFDLGGDSIVAIRLVGRARLAGWDISLREVFEHRTVRGMAAAARPVDGQADSAESIDLLRTLTPTQRQMLQQLSPGHGEVLPLAPLQEGLYFHAAMVRGDLDVYQVQNCVQFDKRVDAADMRWAGTQLLRRYPNLRAGFHHEDLDQPVQVIAAELPMPLVEIDLTGTGPGELDRAIDDFVTNDVAVGFDLARPPLMRLALLHLPTDRTGHQQTLLVVTHHHILTDGWSQTLFMADLLELYGHAADGHSGAEATTLDPAPEYTQYLRYVAGTDPAVSRQAWAKALADIDGSTLLVPVAAAEHAVLSDVIDHQLSLVTTDGLRALARHCGVTVSTLLATAWGLTLRSLTGRDDIVFGTTVSGRPAEIPDVERMVGMLMNTVPVRVRVDPAQTMGALLYRIMLEQADLMPHHHLGLAHIQAAAGVGALFDTLYVFRNLPVDAAAQQDRFERQEIGRTTAMDGTHYAMTMAVNPGDRLSIDLAYRPDLVDRDRAATTLRRYIGLLEQMAAPAADSRPVAAFEMLLPAEHAQLAAWNATGTTEDETAATVVDVLRRTAVRTPDSVALVVGGREITFGDLLDRTDRLAALLRDRGVRAESIVAICLPRTADAVIAILAVLAAGGAYLPLDRDNPGDRLAAMVADAGAGWMITDAAGAHLVPVPAGTDAILVDDPETENWLQQTDPVAGRGPVHPDSPAYVIYTSGSTGRPKGVVVGHRGLTNMLVNHRAAIFDPAIAVAAGNGVTRPLRVAHTVSFAFDMSWEELFWMADGHTVHVIDEAARLDVATLVEHYHRIGIDVINVTPSYAAELLDAGLLDTGPAGDRRGPSLVLLGGEAVPTPLWQRLRKAPGVMSYNLYGPTEYTINALGADLADSEHPSVGTPIRNTAARVLDSGLRPVPVGAVGELYLSGIGCARGYLGRPELTAQRFVADPATPGGRLYRTGDLVRYRPGGALEYLGRSDDQVKIRGFRVELGEIESVLGGLPGVRSAVAVVHSGDLLVGYLVADGSDRGLDVGQLRRIVTGLLPAAMVPAEWVVLAALPLTVNGKVDRAALPAPQRTHTAGRPPADARERLVCAAAAQVLGIDDGVPVGPDDNFFELGGHSLLAMRLAARIKADAGLVVPVGLVMATASLGELAAEAGRIGRDSALAPVLTLRPGGSPPLFCVHPASGFAWQYAGLLPYLEPDRPVIGLQSPMLSGAAAPQGMDELAQRYLELIRQEQPAGPYHLLGYSFGGTVAHHVAALLTAAGEQVAFLGIIDAGPRTGGAPDPGRVSRHQDDAGVQDELRFLLQVAGAELGADVDVTDRAAVLSAIKNSQGVLAGFDAPLLEAIAASDAWCDRLLNTGTSPVAPTDMVLVSSLHTVPADQDPADPWRPHVAGSIAVQRIDADHQQLMAQDQLREIGPFLAERLTDATARRPASTPPDDTDEHHRKDNR